MLALSKMAAAVQPSATLAAGAKAKQLKAEGVNVFDFSLGEPDFPTPEHICAAAVRAMQAGHTHYTPASGIPELRKAIAKLVRQDLRHPLHRRNRSSSPAAPSTRSTQRWPPSSAPAMRSSSRRRTGSATATWCEMTGAKYVLVPTTLASGFKMSPAQLRAAVTPRTKLLMLNSPSNPTGTVYTRA